MIDIKLRNVKFEDACRATLCVEHFMNNYSDRIGVRNGVGYDRPCLFYVYRTEKTVICVGQYDE